MGEKTSVVYLKRFDPSKIGAKKRVLAVAAPFRGGFRRVRSSWWVGMKRKQKRTWRPFKFCKLVAGHLVRLFTDIIYFVRYVFGSPHDPPPFAAVVPRFAATASRRWRLQVKKWCWTIPRTPFCAPFATITSPNPAFSAATTHFVRDASEDVSRIEDSFVLFAGGSLQIDYVKSRAKKQA